jgi:hypothetical protein
MFAGSDARRAYRALDELGGAAGPTAVAEKIGWTRQEKKTYDDGSGGPIEVNTWVYDRERAMTALCALVETGKIEAIPVDP